jgi:hypothetical protein
MTRTLCLLMTVRGKPDASEAYLTLGTANHIIGSLPVLKPRSWRSSILLLTPVSLAGVVYQKFQHFGWAARQFTPPVGIARA